MGQTTKEFQVSAIGDSVTPGTDSIKLGIPMIKAMIAETTEGLEPDYIEGVKFAYLIHPPQLQDELRGRLSTLPVPAMTSPPSRRLISVVVDQKTLDFVVEPYEMDLTRRRSEDPRWLIVILFNPDMPAMGVKVEAQGPLTFKEPTPLLSETKVAENWAMEKLRVYLRDIGMHLQNVSQEPNGPSTFPDFRARLNGVQWDFEVTRVLGDILKSRHILDQPRNSKKNIDMAVQSPPIDEQDVEDALTDAINKKRCKRQSDGPGRNLFLVLVNPLDLDIKDNVDIWDDLDLTEFDAVVLISGYPQPSLELVKWPF